ncbi:MAG: hypothetical protein FJX95_03585 [Bacteroidetes bacterium]|nr:hypothetical protein [Bacteroidota bacterium]
MSGDINLQLTLRTQKLLHQWVMTHTGNAAQWKTFSFSSTQWSQWNEEQKKEFHVDGIWYDTKEISWDNNQVRVLAKADKWENIFKDLIPCPPENPMSQKSIEPLTVVWKYLLPPGFSSSLAFTSKEESLQFPNLAFPLISTDLKSIFKPPICN